MLTTPQYLVIGHVTHDLAPDGSFTTGGTATYSALTASRLGLTVGVLTSTGAACPLLESVSAIRLHVRASQATTTFENLYASGHRRQYLRAVAERLTSQDLPSDWEQAPIVHLGPVAQEVDPGLVSAFPKALLGVTPQGWLRRWDEAGLVSAIPWASAEQVLERADVVVMSPEDVGDNRAEIERYRRLARLFVLTVGREGCLVYYQGQERRVPAFVAQEVDPTGAGDVFATGFLIRLHETGDPLEAARYANCVASFVVEGEGASMVPTREEVLWRLQHGKRRD